MVIIAIVTNRGAGLRGSVVRVWSTSIIQSVNHVHSYSANSNSICIIHTGWALGCMHARKLKPMLG